MKNMKLNPVYFIIASVIFLSVGCKKGYELEDINSDITVESFQEDGKVYIHAETEEGFSCSNYMISYKLKENNSGYTVKFKKVIVTDVCFSPAANAYAYIDLGEISEGQYKIEFKLNGNSTEGILHVNDSTRLEIATENGVKIK